MNRYYTILITVLLLSCNVQNDRNQLSRPINNGLWRHYNKLYLERKFCVKSSLLIELDTVSDKNLSKLTNKITSVGKLNYKKYNQIKCYGYLVCYVLKLQNNKGDKIQITSKAFVDIEYNIHELPFNDFNIEHEWSYKARDYFLKQNKNLE